MTIIDWDSVADEVKRQRACADIDQKTAAARIGVNASSLCRLEAGKSVSADTLMRVFMWLGESPIAYCFTSEVEA